MSEISQPAQLPGTALSADFKLIRGIGPGVEQRLLAAGVTTYTQVAALTPEDLAELLAGLVGLTAERIRQYDWVGRAAELAERLAAGDIPAEPASRLHYATYHVELLVDETQRARRTRVTHIQSGQEHTWAGWDSQRLAAAIEQTAMLYPEALATAALPESGPSTLPMIEKDNLSQPLAVPQPSVAQAIAPTLQLTHLEFVSQGVDDTGRLLRYDVPFDAVITLEFRAAGAGSYEYQALVLAKSLNRSARVVVGRADGQLAPAERITLIVPGAGLEPGMYRTEALVVVMGAGVPGGAALRHSAMLEGGLVQIY